MRRNQLRSFVGFAGPSDPRSYVELWSLRKLSVIMRRIVGNGIKQQVQLVSERSSGIESVPLIPRDRVAVIAGGTTQKRELSRVRWRSSRQYPLLLSAPIAGVFICNVFCFLCFFSR